MENTYREYYHEFCFLECVNNTVLPNPNRKSLNDIKYCEKMLFENG